MISIPAIFISSWRFYDTRSRLIAIFRTISRDFILVYLTRRSFFLGGGTKILKVLIWVILWPWIDEKQYGMYWQWKKSREWRKNKPVEGLLFMLLCSHKWRIKVKRGCKSQRNEKVADWFRIGQVFLFDIKSLQHNVEAGSHFLSPSILFIFILFFTLRNPLHLSGFIALLYCLALDERIKTKYSMCLVK